MRLLARLLEPKATAYGHCDLPCGVYDPAQARIEAESVKAISQKYQDNPAAGAVDSRAFGAVPGNLIEGRVLLRYWPLRRD